MSHTGPSDKVTAAPRRPTCTRCLRPSRTCLCSWITPTPNEVEVLLLQHPLEVHQAKGSAKLLALSLRHCTLAVGEAFEPAALRALLDAPTQTGRIARNVLLYPDQGQQSAAERGGGHTMTDDPADTTAARRLIVLDGTWRKSAKILHLNPALLALPRLSLQADAPSRYLIRKAPRAGRYATLQAVCMALGQLEAAHERYGPLQVAFDHFVKAWPSA